MICRSNICRLLLKGAATGMGCVLPGCRSVDPATAKTGVTAESHAVQGDLIDEVGIAREVPKVLPAIPLKAAVVLPPKSRKVLQFESRFEWFDARVFAVGGDLTNRRPVQVDPHQTVLGKRSPRRRARSLTVWFSARRTRSSATRPAD